jgi:hypothetical protein
MNQDNCTSQDLSKRLDENGCELESECFWGIDESVTRFCCEMVHYDKKFCDVLYPAYDLLWDICVRYAKEFFGGTENIVYKCVACGCITKELKSTCDSYRGCLDFYRDEHGDYDHRRAEEEERTAACYAVPQSCFNLLQQGKKQEAEDLIWEHCVFNPENK